MTLFRILIGAVVLVFIPTAAHAWGPITHIDYAQEALRHVAAYGPAVKLLLQQFPYDFLYGSLAADITLGKDYVDYVHNCHSWRVGFLIFDDARDDRQKAAALGYLSHLAVDIISHNFFVPYKTIFSYPSRTLGHVYWEMRFDAKRPVAAWNLAKEVSRMDFSHDDELFQRMVKRTLFSFRTNKRIFNSVLTLHRLRHWRSMMEKVHEVSRFRLLDADVAEYRALAIDSVTKFLKNPEKAPCTRVDPTGAAKLLYASETRGSLKKMTRKGLISGEDATSFLKKVRMSLKETIYCSDSAVDLPSVSDLF